MNKIFGFLVVVFSMVMLHSCTTSQKITIQGTPGTEIYSPGENKLGVIDANGQISIKISSYDYYSYLMSRNAGTNQLVPFALDYKHHRYTGTYMLRNLGYVFVGAGMGCFLAMTAALAIDSESSFASTAAGAALGSGALGAALVLPAGGRAGQTQYNHKYKYLSVQKTNQDLQFTKIVDTGYDKTHGYDANTELATPISTEISSNNSSTIKRRKSSTSKRTLTDNANAVSGTYKGSGNLAQKGKVIEKYTEMKVVVLRIDRNTVNIDVYENGESFFSAKTTYQVNKKGKNTYVLSLEGNSDAFITIDNAGHLTYMHPKVNIDGEIYTLNITANKE